MDNVFHCYFNRDWTFGKYDGFCWIVQITLCNYYLKNIKTIKIGFIVNSAIYIVYFLAIWDFSSTIIETITALIGLISLFKLVFYDSKENDDVKSIDDEGY